MKIGSGKGPDTTPSFEDGHNSELPEAQRETATGSVEGHLDRDPVFVELLARGIINLRRSARWLIDYHEWDWTEEAIVSGIRRYQEIHGPNSSWEEGDGPVGDVSWDCTTGLGKVVVPSTQDALARCFNSLPPIQKGSWIFVVPTSGEVSIITPWEAELKKAIGEEDTKSVTSDLAAFRIHLPGESRQLAVQQTLVSALDQRHVRPVETFTADNALVLIVKQTVSENQDSFFAAADVLEAFFSREE